MYTDWIKDITKRQLEMGRDIRARFEIVREASMKEKVYPEYSLEIIRRIDYPRSTFVRLFYKRKLKYITRIEYTTLVRKKDDNGVWRLIRVMNNAEFPSFAQLTLDQMKEQVLNMFLGSVYTVMLFYILTDSNAIDNNQESEEQRLGLRMRYIINGYKTIKYGKEI